MKKTTLLNQALSEVIAGMGHGDLLAIGDYGLPCPRGVRRIDLALRPGVPGFLETVEAVLSELQVETAYVAAETYARNTPAASGLEELLDSVALVRISHEDLKRMSAGAAVVVRTGECKPYANVILRAGVTF